MSSSRRRRRSTRSKPSRPSTRSRQWTSVSSISRSPWAARATRAMRRCRRPWTASTPPRQGGRGRRAEPASGTPAHRARYRHADHRCGGSHARRQQGIHGSSTLRLIAEPGAVERFLGFAPRERFLMPNTALDARHVIYPPLLIDGDRGFMLLEEIERGSVPAAALPPGVTPSYYAPYFRWDPAERSQIPHTVCDALRQVAGDVEVAVDAFASIFLVRAIRASVPAELAAPWRNRTWRRRRIRTHDVEARFRRTRSAATEATLLSLKGDRDERRLRNAVEGARSGGRFASLDALLGEVGLDVVVLSAPLNVQDVTGITVSDLLWPAIAHIERCADYVEMLQPCAGEAATISLAEVATRLRGRRFGIDEQYLTVGQADRKSTRLNSSHEW